MLYDADAFLLDSLVGFIAPALLAGQRAAIVATPEHRDGAAARLRALGLDVAAAMARGQFLAADARATLERFMVGGRPCAQAFELVLDELLLGASPERPARLFGEMVALLASDGLYEEAFELEAIWNRAFEKRTFSLLCAYPMAVFAEHSRSSALLEACSAHTSVVPCESYTTLLSRDDRLREVAVLQQKAAALESALIAERQARDAAEAALRVRDEFLSTASHELRTPIAIVSAQAQLALRRWQRDGRLDSDRAIGALRAIESQTGKLARLVALLLEVSRLDAGRLALEPGPTDVAALVREVAEVSQALSERHPIAVAAPQAVIVCVDPLRLEQVLLNLFDNAIKYSPDGAAIDVSVTPQPDGWVDLIVRDHGPGVPLDKREQIFDRFFQAHPDGGSGLGLGLYLCRAIVELHGGELTAEFPSDGGTRFHIRLRG